jgi:hypothetical protein
MNKLHDIYCRNCRKITKHEDQGSDIRPDFRYICIDCLSHNEMTEINTIKQEITNDQI